MNNTTRWVSLGKWQIGKVVTANGDRSLCTHLLYMRLFIKQKHKGQPRWPLGPVQEEEEQLQQQGIRH